MAKRTHTLTPRQAEQLPRVISAVLGDGGAGGSRHTTTPGRADRAMIGKWAKIVDYDDDGNGVSRGNYVLAVYPSYGASTAMPSAGGLPGRNAFEKLNTSTIRAGYTLIDEESAVCGDIIGILPIPYNESLWVQILDLWYDGPTPYLIFAVRNDPVFKES